MTRQLETDYLVVGSGAMGMAFTDALVDHADVHVTLVDRRHAAGGHWLDAYPFVQLHQASVFYGVASTALGNGAVQSAGPEAGFQERARQSEILAYYGDILQRRLVGSGRVTFLGGSEYRHDGSRHLVTSQVSGVTTEVKVRRRVVDATYLSPTIPATTSPPFDIAAHVDVAPINELARLGDTPSSYVIVGSGKTATDGIVWLRMNGVPPDRIVWVRPRDPWMTNRAVVQPDPVVALTMAADTMEAAASAESLDDLFLRLEAAGVMFRIDPHVMPTMAKAPTLATWELDLLRTIENVVRLGHIKRVDRREIVLTNGSVALTPGSLVVHCAASGLRYPPRVDIWGLDRIRLQTIRAGFPCFNAALAGYVEATRDDDRERNRLCPPNALPDTPASWTRMQVRGSIATRIYSAEPDIAAWAHGCALNPVGIAPARRNDPAVQTAATRLADHAQRGLARMDELAPELLSSVTGRLKRSGRSPALPNSTNVLRAFPITHAPWNGPRVTTGRKESGEAFPPRSRDQAEAKERSLICGALWRANVHLVLADDSDELRVLPCRCCSPFAATTTRRDVAPAEFPYHCLGMPAIASRSRLRPASRP